MSMKTTNENHSDFESYENNNREGIGNGLPVAPFGFSLACSVTRTSHTRDRGKLGNNMEEFLEYFTPVGEYTKTVNEAGITHLFESHTDINEVQSKIAHNIKALRDYFGVSASRLSCDADVTRQYINQIEAGCKIPSITVLCDIANSLHTTPEMLMSANMPNHYIYYMQVLFNELAKKAPEKQETILRDVIKYVANA